MKKKKKVTRKRKILVSRDGLHSMQVSGDDMLKLMNPSEPANPMMGLASQIEKDMFASQRVGSDKQEDPKKDTDTGQPGKSEKSSCPEALQFLAFFAIVGAIVFGIYSLVTYGDYTAGVCYSHVEDKNTVAKITRAFNGLRDVDYEVVSSEDKTFAKKNRTHKDFGALYPEETDCQRFTWRKEYVLGTKEN